MKLQSISVSLLAAALLGLTACGETDSEEENSTSSTIDIAYVKLFGTTAKDFADASAYDSENNLYVVGSTKGNFETAQDSSNYDIFLRKLDPNGNTLCQFQYGSNSDDSADNVVIDSQNNIYVFGATYGDFDGHTHIGNQDIYVMKFNSSCEKQDSILIGTMEDDDASGMGIDGDDNIYISGSTNGSINNQPSQGGTDFFITKLNSDLTEIWTTQDGSNGNDWSEDMAKDNNGALYVVGSIDNDIEGETSVRGGEDCLIAKYNTGDGSRIWARSFGSENDNGGTDAANSVAVNSKGDAVVGYRSVADGSGIAYFSADGVKEWWKETEGYTNIPVAVGKDDTIYSGDGSYGSYKTLRKFTKDGEWVWSAQMQTVGTFTNMWHKELTYNPNDGYVYVVGATETNFAEPFTSEDAHTGSYDAYVVKYK